LGRSGGYQYAFFCVRLETTADHHHLDIYEDRKKNWIDEHVLAPVRELDSELSSTLQALHLPAALDALDKSIGLPPSLVKKAEEVRLEDGPRRVEVMLADIQTLAQHAGSLLEEAMDIIDDALADGDTSHQPLLVKYERYTSVLSEAAHSDALSAARWAEWADRVTDLAQPPAVLEAAVPATTGAAAAPRRETKVHARALRRALEALDDGVRARADVARRAQQLADADDVRPRVAREAAGVARWAEVAPAMFEDTMQDELRKFAKFERDVEDGAAQQRQLLQDLTVGVSNWPGMDLI
jgi:programmed cell death 6-interacting protein